MKRVGNLIPLICTRENILKSIKETLKGSKRRKTKSGKYILSHTDEIVQYVIN